MSSDYSLKSDWTQHALSRYCSARRTSHLVSEELRQTTFHFIVFYVAVRHHTRLYRITTHHVMLCDRIVYMEPLPFKEQIKVYASSQVLIMTHGAALVNIMFMPEVWILQECQWNKLSAAAMKAYDIHLIIVL